MERPLEQLTAEAMQLSTNERALLADRLVESLDFPEPTEILKLWTAEAIRRRDEIDSGKVQTIPGDQVFAEANRIVGR